MPSPNPLPKIPSDLSHYWREFRHGVMPFIVFIAVLGATLYLWNTHLAPPSIVGQVEMVRANVTTTAPGEIMDLQVDLFQRVVKDEPIAVVQIMDDDILSATIRSAEADLLTMRARLLDNQMRVAQNYEQLQQTLMTRRVERATENVNLQLAISDFQRISKLFQEKAVSEAEYDMARAKMEALKEKLTELNKLIAETERSLENLKPSVNVTNSLDTNEVWYAAIRAREEMLRATTRPLIIKAPMSGVVSAVLKRKGERVIRGDTIVTISTLEPERILGYVRQPLREKPKPGDIVQVRGRGNDRIPRQATVLKVGTQLELIDPSLLPLQTAAHVTEYGLPLLITLPRDLHLMPGEIVDITPDRLR